MTVLNFLIFRIFLEFSYQNIGKQFIKGRDCKGKCVKQSNISIKTSNVRPGGIKSAFFSVAKKMDKENSNVVLSAKFLGNDEKT